MRTELSTDEGAELRRVLRHLEDEAPVAPDLPGLPLVADSRRRWSPAAITVGAFVAALAVIGPAAWLLGGNGRTDPSSTTAPVVADGSQVESSATLTPEDTGPNIPTTAAELQIPDVFVLEPVSTPITGVEFFELAANDYGLFAATSVPNPDMWDERVWKSVDDGASWQSALEVAGEGIIVDIAAAGTELDVLVSGHVVDGPSYLYQSFDGGEMWARIEIPEPEAVAGASARLLVIGDSTIVVGLSWDSVLEESFDDGKVLSSTRLGVRPLAWRVDGDQLADAVEVAAGGAVLDTAWTGKLYVAVGLAEIDSSELAVWTSVDGTTWLPSPLPDLPPGIETDGFESVTVSGTGTVVAMADVIGDDQHAIAFVTTDTTEWSIADIADVAFVHTVGTDWGFVAGANERGAWEDRLLVASPDGENWTIVSRPEAFILGSGVSTPSGVFMNGRSPAIDGAGIWVITTP